MGEMKQLILVLIASLWAEDVQEQDLSKFPAHKAYVDAPGAFLESEDGEQPESPFEDFGVRRRLDFTGPGFSTGIILPKPGCDLTLDVLFLQDITNSFRKLLPVFTAQLAAIMKNISASYPDSKFAVSAFQDVPIPWLGSKGDVCLSNKLSMTDNTVDVIKAYGNLRASGGGDKPEYQYPALMYSALDDSIGWRPEELADGRIVLKLVILVTDAGPHLAGDGRWYGLRTNPGTLPLNCKRYDYPSIEKVASAMKRRMMIPAFVLPSYEPGLHKLYDEFIDVALGKDAGVTVSLRDGATALVDAVEEAVNRIVLSYCDELPDVVCTKKEFLLSRDLSLSTHDNIEHFESWITAHLGSEPEMNNVMFISHTDKPLPPFGYPRSLDYCYWNHWNEFLPYAEFFNVYSASEDDTRSGGDFAENQLDAVIRGLRESTNSWTVDELQCRCVLILTDSFAHVAGDFSEGATYNPVEPSCLEMDYPSLGQFAEALEEHTSCVRIVTEDVVEQKWLDYLPILREFGYTGTWAVELLPKTGRRLRASEFDSPQEPRNLEGKREVRF